VGLAEVLAWIVFLPTYPSGPMATLDEFRGQSPTFDRARALGGLERILFGLVKSLLVAYYLGVWAEPIVAHPEQYASGTLLLGLYAASLRFYFDFAATATSPSVSPPSSATTFPRTSIGVSAPQSRAALAALAHDTDALAARLSVRAVSRRLMRLTVRGATGWRSPPGRSSP
jgi:hypothetical protein